MKDIPSNDEIHHLFLEDCDYRGLSKKTLENYGSSARKFIAFIDKPLSEVGMHELRDYLGLLKNNDAAPSTVSKHFSAIQGLFDYMEMEDIIDRNPVPKFRKRYLQTYKKQRRQMAGASQRQLIKTEDLRRLINYILDPKDKAIVTLLAKTGVRRGELIEIDVDDINWEDYSIELKPTPKRSNKIVFFDEECALILRRWLMVRDNRYNPRNTNALFLNERGTRLNRNGIYNAVVKYAKQLGLHNPESKKLKEKFTPHCFRHWFTTALRKSGMEREYIKELRGDARSEAMDIYYHISQEELRDSYLAHMPELGI